MNLNLSKIDHPNVVKLYEIYEDDTYFYMVLELMTGGEVLQIIYRSYLRG
jgi:calcium/calmodulin-dependent protein kinase I